MNYSKGTTYVVIKFNKKTKNGKYSIDLVPISWTFQEAGRLWCKYPNKKEYNKLDKMCKTSSAPDSSWKKFEVSLVTEAHDYEQGHRRMSRAFSEMVIHSSNIEDVNSSEEEQDPLLLSKNDLSKSLENIPSFNVTKSKLTNVEKEQLDVSDIRSLTDIELQSSSDDSRSSVMSRKTPLKKYNKQNLERDESDSSSTSSSPPSKKQKIVKSKSQSHHKIEYSNKTNLTKSEKLKKTVTSTENSNVKKSDMRMELNIKEAPTTSHSTRDGYFGKVDEQTSQKDENNYSSSASSPPTKEKQPKSKNQGGRGERHDSKSTSTMSRELDKEGRSKKQKNKYCSTCGSLVENASKSDIQSAKRSLEHTIQEEAKQTRALISAITNASDIQKIFNEKTITDLPKTTLESFLTFENQLKKEVELVQKMKLFVLINVRSTLKISENFTTIIPAIISKNVQLLYSAFGREMNGFQKLNFSTTETYKLLLEAINNKFPETTLKDIKRDLSRWFSNAKDREGGRKERIYKKKQEKEKERGMEEFNNATE